MLCRIQTVFSLDSLSFSTLARVPMVSFSWSLQDSIRGHRACIMVLSPHHQPMGLRVSLGDWELRTSIACKWHQIRKRNQHPLCDCGSPDRRKPVDGQGVALDSNLCSGQIPGGGAPSAQCGGGTRSNQRSVTEAAPASHASSLASPLASPRGVQVEKHRFSIIAWFNEGSGRQLRELGLRSPWMGRGAHEMPPGHYCKLFS